MHSVLVLGGYGFFGTRIAATLARDANLRVLVGGRDAAKANAMAASLGLAPDRAVAIDATGGGLARTLAELKVDTLVHTAGPFQGQDYAVARAAIDAGCNYIDLADGRAFVCGITALDAQARARGVAVIAGASSVPGLSSAVVERYRAGFARLDAIRIGIASGGRAPGLATMRGVFGYCGHAFARLEDGAWTQTHGWLDATRHRFPPPVGMRWLGSCDVPDLELLPRRHPGVRTVTFHAGFADPAGHFVVWLGAHAVKKGLLRSLAPLAPALHRVAGWLERFTSDAGAMFVELRGTGADGAARTRCWNLLAAQNHGPWIPCGASVALVRKLASATPPPAGAYACAGVLDVDEYLAPLRELDLRVVADAP